MRIDFPNKTALMFVYFLIVATATFSSPAAFASVCGDSEPDPGEQCDDGNLSNGDGCSATCVVEVGFDCTAAIAGQTIGNILVDGSFEDGNIGGEWTSIEHSLLGSDLICGDACFGTPLAAGPDGNWVSGNFVLVAGGTFDGNSTGNVTHGAVAIPANATTLEFQWETISGGTPGDPCAGPTDGLALSIGGTPVWSNLDGPVNCTYVNPYQRVVIDLATAAGGPYAGTTVGFEFTASATGLPPGVALTNVLLDDVSINFPLVPPIPPVPSACAAIVCGDGLLGTGEACDDGNTTGGDGCSASCQVEQPNFICDDPIPPASSGDNIRDGSLERSDPNTEWEQNGTEFAPICSEALCGLALANSGAFYGWFGGSVLPNEQILQQTLSIASTATELTFELNVGVCDSADDYLAIKIDGTEIYHYDCTSTTIGYQTQTVDITGFADGAAHTLQLFSQTVATNGSNSNFFVDDISIKDNVPFAGTPSACFELPTACTVPEQFDAGIPAAWSVINLGTDVADGWGTSNDGICASGYWSGGNGDNNVTGGDGPAACADSDATGKTDTDGGGTAQEMDTYLCSPAMDLTQVTSPQYSFLVNYQANRVSSPDDSLEVLVGTASPNALTVSGYTSLGNVLDHLGSTLELSQSQALTANLAAHSSESDAYVCFHYRGTYDWYAQIDNAALRGSSCAPPPGAPGIDIEKATNGVDADDPNAGDAPVIVIGGLVTWTYLVTNTGDVALSNVTVIDDQGVAVSCPQTTLSIGESMSCTASGLAEDLAITGFTTVPGQCGGVPGTLYENIGSVRAEYLDQGAEDSDPSHYCNAVVKNTAPVAVNNNYSGPEDNQLSGNVITDNTGEGIDGDADDDVLSISSNTDVSNGTLVLNSGGSFTYDPNLNYCGPDSFTYVVTDNPPATPPMMTSNTATVSITVNCVNDPPVVSSIVAGEQTSDYSDFIGTVTITVEDVDDTSTNLAESDEPPFSAAGLSLVSTGCTVNTTESPDEDGSTCSWDYDGQVIDPGNNVYDIVFTSSDAEGEGGTGMHELSIQPEDATVTLDSGNEVAVEVATEGGDSGIFKLWFSAKEANDPDNPHDGTAQFGNLNEMVPIMTLLPVGPGGPISADSCSFIPDQPVYPGEGYSQVAMFECSFDGVPVNAYEILAEVNGTSDSTIYYTGSDEDVLVVNDPSLGFVTGGGWFYWPGSEDNDYPGDRTNFGFNMKYNKKRTKIQGNLLLMRHTITDDSYKVKSNSLDGMSLGAGTDEDGAYGWAAFSGKSTYRAPGFDNEGNHSFVVYIEDHEDQGCNQDPVDEFWVEVKDRDGNVVLEVNGPDSDPAGDDEAIDGDDEPIECGNIVVPHKSGGKGRPKSKR